MDVSKNLRKTAAVLLPLQLIISPATAQENCLFQLSPSETPFTVLGTPVTPQSNYIVVDDCGKTIGQVRLDLIAPGKGREQGIALKSARERQLRAEGDELVRRRDEIRDIEAKKSGTSSWHWSRLWGSTN